MKEGERGVVLTALARASIEHELGLCEFKMPADNWLQEEKATFITLYKNGELRGCIGTIEAHQSLGADIRQNAVAAAFDDNRFPSVQRDEFDQLQIEVSVLSPLLPMTFSSEEDALSQLRPGIDGVVFEYTFHRATYLPQVWEKVPEPHHFMASLKHKAGLPADFWDKDVKLFRYTLEKYSEDENR